MPVTVKFSEEFYERLGHDVADELVDWFNTVDASYRSDLRDLFQGRFSALDTKVEERFAAFGARFAALDEKFAAFEAKFNARLAAFEEKFAAFEAKFNARFAAFEEKSAAKLAVLDAKLEGHIGEVRSELREEIAGLRVDMHRMETRLIRWMVAMWASTIGTMIALMRFSG